MYPFLHRKKDELILGPSFGRTLIWLAVLVVVVVLLISGMVKPRRHSAGSASSATPRSLTNPSLTDCRKLHT
jgi:hypothetical protein